MSGIRFDNIVDDSGTDAYQHRILIATPATGLVRIEWAAARYGMVVPVNWSQVSMIEAMSAYFPLRYMVADAQNLCVQACLEGGYEWLLFLEHDTMPPPDMLLTLNEYLYSREIPIVSGLYYTRSRPSEPLVFRGRGNGVYLGWQMGDKVWCDGVPTGCLLIHSKVLKLMWEESAEYEQPLKAGKIARRVFDTPRHLWTDPEDGAVNAVSGTSDLEWCTRVMEGQYIQRAGWESHCPDPRFPFLVDTRIFCKHISQDGEQFP